LASKLGQYRMSRNFHAPKPAPNGGGEEAPDLGPAVARLVIPRLDVHLFVVEGTDMQDLRIGPGHMEGTALPGQAGNCVIAGHRDTHFRPLKDLEKGDDIVLQTRYGEYHYKVVKTTVVSPNDTKPLDPTKQPVLHLITCYPFYYIGSAPKRFVVTAQLDQSQTYSTSASNTPRS
jgi:sortase A